jgi:hypothetical protein|tara:strand:- start:182 stop:490 length:309 start_codon:yes stop_codon:yes gene_type:complete
MGQRNIDNFETFLDEAIKNIRADRAVTGTLLADLMIEIKKAPTDDPHRDLGLIAAKYVETLQRSNEQLVKISAILQKKAVSSPATLSEDDKNELFDLIQETT